tara:strand:- start:5536 stop:5796 length:261 start_codon:yes stop_codon:yes gene_type:complete
MKTVKFDLVLSVHDDLKEDELRDSLDFYLVNDKVINSLVTKVIGEKGAPENFFIHSMELKEQTKPKKDIGQSSVKKVTYKKQFDVV